MLICYLFVEIDKAALFVFVLKEHVLKFKRMLLKRAADAETLALIRRCQLKQQIIATQIHPD